MKIIVLRSTVYKEKDYIYDAIANDGYLSFKVRGGASNNSKYLWLNNPLTVADVEFIDDGRYKYPVLKEAMLISSPISGIDSFDYLSSVSVVQEVATSMIQDEEKHLLFNDLDSSLTALRNKKDSLLVLLILLAKAMRITGSELEVDKCVYCGATKEIVTFSFAEGGFVCRKCFEKGMENELAPSQMKLIRYAFRAVNYSCVNSEQFSLDDKKVVLRAFKEYIYDFLGVDLKSINYLIK